MGAGNSVSTSGLSLNSLQNCCHASKIVSADVGDRTDNAPRALMSLVYVETDNQDTNGNAGKDATSRSSSHSSMSNRVRGMAVLQTLSTSFATVPLGQLDKNAVLRFRELLHNHGLDTTKWGVNGAKSVEHLFWEVHSQRGSILTGVGSGKLKRVTRLLKIRIIADIFGVDHVLISKIQFMHDGQHILRTQVPLKKLIWKLSPDSPVVSQCDESFYAEDCPHVENWRQSCVAALQERLGLTERTMQMQFEEDQHTYAYHTEDNQPSHGYPGLNTLYCVHQATFRILNPQHVKVACLGLPHGQDFATADLDFDFNFSRRGCEDRMPIGSQLNIWSWSNDKSLLAPKAIGNTSVPSSPSAKNSVSDNAVKLAESEMRMIKRVPLPEMAAEYLVHRDTTGLNRPPSNELWAALDNRSTNWATVRRMARSIMDPEYSLIDFNKDLAAFPELSLYLRDGASVTSSSRTVGDEYQRTVGAFFAIYWLMRTELDGREGFTFGVDKEWVPPKASAVKKGQGTTDENSGAAGNSQHCLFNVDRRVTFFKDAKWDFFRRLLFDAGLLEEVSNHAGQPKKTASGQKQYRVNERRMVSLLALTAIHDIMKMDVLLPTVQPEHAGYHGYAVGDVIADHDHALSYLMDHYPELLPSFMDLDPVERRSVQFTQCNLCFNHGWFVQAEAPPGAIFTKFREAIIQDHKSEVGARDVALYFVHWLTDLAGAEPTPLGGCEKFVIKFPIHVLNSFLRSFKFVEGIAVQTETEVMESYLKYRWTDFSPYLGDPPTGPSAIAAMRLLCMAQANGQRVVEAFETDVPPEDKEVLSLEMARTGCAGQSYSSDLVPPELLKRPAGPAFLIYYGPAFLQAIGSDSIGQRLRMLAEVYRCARELWPESPSQMAACVYVRIDTIKGLSLTDIKSVMMKGELWLIAKHNESEAFVERASHKRLNTFVSNFQKFQILDLGFLTERT
eukprot:gb/GFBE01072188.1/.p1 GENE.gb/GFBE01072188.1/~~gb/GFBE01072188.1/.p1  ORF type:complete len:957 (+),score=177.15 gb/GFBE01072188.1/:1-2871(+)